MPFSRGEIWPASFRLSEYDLSAHTSRPCEPHERRLGRDSRRRPRQVTPVPIARRSSPFSAPDVIKIERLMRASISACRGRGR